MLAPPEAATYAHAKLWFASQPDNAEFAWDSKMCACQCYANEHQLGNFHKYADLREIDAIAAKLVWGKPPGARVAKFSDLAKAL
jgi:hypothetical protein